MGRYRVGVSISLYDDFAENVKKAEDAGLDSLDFDLCKFWPNREAEIKNYRLIGAGLETIAKSPLFFNGIHVSFGPNWDFSSLDEEKRRAAVKQTLDVFSRCDPYGPFCYILHGSFEPIRPEDRQESVRRLKESLAELKAGTDTIICVETLPRTCLFNTAREAARIADEVGGISLCIDVNHFLQEKTEDAIKHLGPRIRTTHISDHDYIDERHWLPGEGRIDWQAVLKAFDEIGYEGVWNYEVNLGNCSTIVRPRALDYRDLRRNADELFAGKKPEPIGHPVEGLYR